MGSVTVRVADVMRTSGYLPADRSSLRLMLKERLKELLSDPGAAPFTAMPNPRESTHESIWMDAGMEAQAKVLAGETGMSLGEVATSVLLRHYEAWSSEQAPKVAAKAEAAPQDDSGVLGEALAARGSSPRYEQIRMLRVMRKLTSEPDGKGKVLFCEAGTGTGKTAAYLACAIELLQKDPVARVMIAAPSFALVQQIGETLAWFGDVAGRPVFLAGQNEWVSESALQRLIDDEGAQLDPKDVEALLRWMKRGGDGSRPAWSMASLMSAFPTFELRADVSVLNREDDEDAGWLAYQAQFERASEARIVVLTHAMLAWLTRRRILAQRRALKGDESVAEAMEAWRASKGTDKEMRWHEAMNLAMQDAGSDAGMDRLPNASLLVIDEAHGFEDTFSTAFGTYESLRALRAIARTLHGKHAKAFLPSSMAMLDQVYGKISAMVSGRGADDVVDLDRQGGLVKMLSDALKIAATPVAASGKRVAAAASASREAKRLLSVSVRLGVIASAMEAGSTYVAAFLHWSPKREFPRISVGQLRLDQELNYLWSCVAERTALVSGTLYEENPSYSCEWIRRSLAVPTSSMMVMEPIHAPWAVAPVTLHMIQAVHAVDGRARYSRPEYKLGAEKRDALRGPWIDDIAEYVSKIMGSPSTAGGVLVVGTAFADIEQLADRLSEVPEGWKLLTHRPGTQLGQMRKAFLEGSKDHRMLMLAVGGAWTGFDLHADDLPDALTDLVIMNAPFGLSSRNVASMRRQQQPNGVFEITAKALLLVRQVVGRLVRSDKTPHNRRIHWLDARMHDQNKGGMMFGIRRFLARYKTIAAG